jgi:hypothetical protein
MVARLRRDGYPVLASKLERREITVREAKRQAGLKEPKQRATFVVDDVRSYISAGLRYFSRQKIESALARHP